VEGWWLRGGAGGAEGAGTWRDFVGLHCFLDLAVAYPPELDGLVCGEGRERGRGGRECKIRL